MIYKNKHKIGIDEVNKNLKLTNKSLITILQNTASFYADSINYGILNIPNTFITWYVTDWKVNIIKRPKYSDELIIKAWGRYTKEKHSYIDFEIYVNKELIVQATSKWIPINIKTHKPEIVNENIIKAFNGKRKKSVFEKQELDHLNILNKYKDKNEITIRKSDLDFNNHVNNANYFDYLTNYSEIRDSNNFRITYRKEIKENEKIYLCHNKTDNIDYYIIIDEKDNIKTIIEYK